jgi:autoinducer 2-degrading protein
MHIMSDPSRLLVHVVVHVHPADVDRFIAATLANARASRQEPGVARFELIQQLDDPTRFLLIEEYRTAEDPARHKATSHYATWRDAVQPMMAEPRQGVQYHALE